MKAWIRTIHPNLTVNVHYDPAHAIGGDPWGKDRQPLLWVLLAAILGGVASGAAEKAATVFLGS
jgi:hypothetical protein